MREHDLQPKMRRRFTTTTDIDHHQPILPNLAKILAFDGPDQPWVAEITYVTIIGVLVYVAVILDAWSRRVVGHAISRSIDARLALAPVSVAIQRRSRLWPKSSSIFQNSLTTSTYPKAALSSRL